MSDDIKQTLLPFLKKVGLAENDSRIELAALSGGVSSDIYRLDMDGKTYCLKQALPKLKVDADWYADTDRSYYESEWLRFAYSVNGKCVPEVIAYDAEAGYILMEYLPPDRYPVWKKDGRHHRCGVRLKDNKPGYCTQRPAIPRKHENYSEQGRCSISFV